MHPRMARARDGDPAATAEVVEALRPRIARMAAYYARCSGEDADDLLQEAWLGLLEALPRLDLTIGSPEQHLIQRARWRLLDAVKRARIRRCVPLEESAADRAPGHDCRGSRPVIETAVGSASIAEFARGLKDRQRAVLDCLLAGLTWREAGRVLGCTAANIAYHVRQIQRQYQEWNADPEAATASGQK